MQQFLFHSDSLQSNPIPFHTLSHPKIKPLLRRYYREKQLDEDNYQKSLKTHSKTFRNVKTNRDKGRTTTSRSIKGYMKDLKAQDSLSKLFYSFNSKLYFENAYLFSRFRGLRNLTSLNVQFYTNRPYHIPLRVLFRSLASLKDLTHFKIELNHYYFIDADFKTLCILFKNLKGLKQLESLSLRFLNCSDLQKAKIHLLPYYLSHLKQLQSLELSFSQSMKLTDQDIMNLASVIPKLPLLTQISLDFESRGRVIQGSTIVHVFQNMGNLSGITLNLGCAEIVKESTNPLSEGLRLLDASSPKKLALRPNQNIDAQNFLELLQTLKRFAALNILHLNLLGCDHLAKSGAEKFGSEFGSALSSLTTLSSFSLKVYRTMQTDSFIGYLTPALRSLHNLVNLKLNCAYSRSHPEQIQQLSASLGALISLKFLDISFFTLESLSDDIMEKLGQSLLKLVQLKHLVLDFGTCNPKMIKNKGVEAVVNSIQELHCLSLLDLNFVQNEEIDDIAVEKIAQALRHLPFLYSANFRFVLCTKLKQNEKSLSSLFNALREMKNIREVYLNLNLNKITEQEVDDLKRRKIVTFRWCS